MIVLDPKYWLRIVDIIFWDENKVIDYQATCLYCRFNDFHHYLSFARDKILSSKPAMSFTRTQKVTFVVYCEKSSSTKQTSEEPRQSITLMVFYLFFHCSSTQWPTVVQVRENIVWNMHLSCMVTANLFYLNQYKPNKTHVIM